MTIYSQLLAGDFAVLSGSRLVYTAPAGNVVVVRDVVLRHDGSATANLYLYTTSGSAITYICGTPAINSSELLHWSGRQVLRPGEQVFVLTNTNNHAFWRVSGYVFTS
jgi:hypothetical protein